MRLGGESFEEADASFSPTLPLSLSHSPSPTLPLPLSFFFLLHEVMYVVYPPGGYYKRHIDSLANVDQMGSGRRSVSFVCYLTPPWTENDGGELRVYGGEHPEMVAEYPPESGSLVVFDSKVEAKLTPPH